MKITADQLETRWKSRGVCLLLVEHRDYIDLLLIYVRRSKREKGLGSGVMQDVVDYADRRNKVIILKPTVNRGTDQGRLIKFYERFGFHHHSETGRMIRRPRIILDSVKAVRHTQE